MLPWLPKYLWATDLLGRRLLGPPLGTPSTRGRCRTSAISIAGDIFPVHHLAPAIKGSRAPQPRDRGGRNRPSPELGAVTAKACRGARRSCFAAPEPRHRRAPPRWSHRAAFAAGTPCTGRDRRSLAAEAKHGSAAALASARRAEPLTVAAHFPHLSLLSLLLCRSRASSALPFSSTQS